ncbi:MAG: hypothetical protein NZ749_14305, partial [bacterium]|nr:hypothetical protein [bacterium]
AVELEVWLRLGELPDLRPDTRMQAFKDCSNVEQNLQGFRQWFRCLNDAFENVVEEVGGRVSMRAGE